MKRVGEPQHLGDMLIRLDNERRNSAAWFALGAVWAFAFPLFKGPGKLWLYFVPLAALLVLSGRGVFWVWRQGRKIEALAKSCTGATEVGPLMRAADRRASFVRYVSRNVLVRLLLELKSLDGALLSPTDLEWMRRQLQAAVTDAFPDRSLLQAILTAETQVATPAVVPVVESLAQSAIHPDIRALAATHLPAVRVRAARSHDEGTLLRPSAGELDPSALLVRPAKTADSEADQLLRAG
jgi:hypothetical protein